MNFAQRLDYYASQNLVAIRTEHSEVSFDHLAQDVIGTSQYFLEQCINANSVVGITIPNELDHIVVTLALIKLGVNQITLPTHYSISVRQELATRVGVTHLISKNIENYIDAQNILYSRDDIPQQEQAKPKRFGESTLYLQTSGTTGISKIIPLLESQLIWQARRSHVEFLNKSFLRLASIEHDSAKRHRLYCLWNGGTNVFRPKDNFDIVSYVQQKEITSIGLSRMQAMSLLKKDEIGNLSSIELHVGGSSVPYKLRAEIESSISKKFYLRYGTSEFGFISIANPGEHDNDECSGQLLDGVELEIVDQSDNTLPKGSKGLIRVKGKGMCHEYYDDIEQSAESFKNGWFYTGDLGYVRNDGQLVVLGRGDNMIIMDTINIYPAEIEKVLEAHSGIRTAIAFPLESVIYGQIPVAAVELNSKEEIESRDLLKYCREKLGIRSPKKVFVLSKFPRNPNGKVNYSQIKQMFYYE
jgi:acyl-CoA synthetase (AMP-forming)/AMP-acid ligase II